MDCSNSYSNVTEKLKILRWLIEILKKPFDCNKILKLSRIFSVMIRKINNYRFKGGQLQAKYNNLLTVKFKK